MTAPDLRFTLALHAQLVGADPTRGFVWSPYSVGSALGLASVGARGETYQELASALAGFGSLDELAKALADGARLDPGAGPEQGAPGARSAVANTMWADATLPVAPDFHDEVRRWPGGTARTVDFANHPDEALNEVNADVERTTNGLIRNLLGPDQVRRDTRAILVNALWLRASWLQAFPESATRPLPFDAPAGRVEVPTMHLQRQMGYAAGHGWQLVSVPAGSGVVADVLLPDDALATAEPALQPSVLDDLLAAAAFREVALWLPRLRVKAQASLSEPLAAVGVRRLFTNSCDLTGVTGGAESLKISAAQHKAVLTLDESGLEGAAATALVMLRTAFLGSPPRPVQVRVDRPFLLLVRHQASGALYFVARVTRP